MQRNTRSICCVVFFADFVKKHVRKMRSTYQKPLHQQIIRRAGFIYKKEDLLIPDPKEDPEGYQKALGAGLKEISRLSIKWEVFEVFIAYDENYLNINQLRSTSRDGAKLAFRLGE